MSAAASRIRLRDARPLARRRRGAGSGVVRTSMARHLTLPRSGHTVAITPAARSAGRPGEGTLVITALSYIGFRSAHASDWTAFGPAVLGAQLADPGADG